MPSKKIRYNFFQIVPKKDVSQPADIQAKLRTALDSTDFPTWKYFGKDVYLTDVKKDGGHFTGTIVLVQTDEIPGKVDVTNRKISEVPLAEHEGLEKHATFLIDPEANILAIESRFPNAGIIVAYLTGIFSLPKSDVAVIINPSHYAKFEELNRITKLTAKIAKIQSSELIREAENTSLSNIIKTADNTNTEEMSFVMTAVKETKNNKSSLNKAVVGNMVKDLLNFKDTEEVTVLKIDGEYYDEDGTVHGSSLDFIKGRLTDFIQMEVVSRHSSVFNTTVKHELLKAMYGKHRTSLITTYKLS